MLMSQWLIRYKKIGAIRKLMASLKTDGDENNKVNTKLFIIENFEDELDGYVYNENQNTTDGETENTTDDENEVGIVFDPDVRSNMGETASSLEDIYGYMVFSDDFAKRIEYIQKKERNEIEQSFTNVFEKDKNTEVEDVFDLVMNSQTEKIITVNYNTKKEKTDSLFSISAYIFLGMFCTTVVIFLMKLIKKKIIKKHLGTQL